MKRGIELVRKWQLAAYDREPVWSPDMVFLASVIDRDLQAAVAEEREACACLADKAADDASSEYKESGYEEQERYWSGRRRVSKMIAAAIRARPK